jgi:hypothetical protein
MDRHKHHRVIVLQRGAAGVSVISLTVKYGKFVEHVRRALLKEDHASAADRKSTF